MILFLKKRKKKESDFDDYFTFFIISSIRYKQPAFPYLNEFIDSSFCNKMNLLLNVSKKIKNGDPKGQKVERLISRLVGLGIEWQGTQNCLDS